MNKLCIIFSILLLTLGCGRFQVFDPPIVDSRLVYYINLYKADKKLYTGIGYIKNIDVIFRSTVSPVIATCSKYANGDRQIEIDPYVWYYELTELERELVLYHEMGHCDLNLGHIEGIGIMNKNVMNDYQFLKDPEKYLKQLFNSKK